MDLKVNPIDRSHRTKNDLMERYKLQPKKENKNKEEEKDKKRRPNRDRLELSPEAKKKLAKKDDLER